MSHNVKDLLVEATKASPLKGHYKTSAGELVEYGSQSHIDDLEQVLVTLVRLRDQQPRQSSSRFAYAKAIEILKGQLRKAKRYFELFNAPIIEEKEE